MPRRQDSMKATSRMTGSSRFTAGASGHRAAFSVQKQLPYWRVTRNAAGPFITPKKAEIMALKIALAQMAPVWLNREATLAKIEGQVEKAAAAGAELIVFGEALLPGYPFWPELTEGYWTSGTTDDNSAQLVWHETDAVFALRRDDEVTPEDEALRAGDCTYRLWTDGALRLESISQEHGVIRPSRPGGLRGRLPVGDRVRVLPNHSCLATACFDRLHVLDGDRITDSWTIHRTR